MKLLIEIPDEQYGYIKRSDKNTFAAVASKECMLHAIKNGIPYEERPYGSWKLIKDKGNNVNAECPFCKFEIECIAYNFSVWEVIQFIKNGDFDFEFPNFCENCGADLREGIKNE